MERRGEEVGGETKGRRWERMESGKKGAS